MISESAVINFAIDAIRNFLGDGYDVLLLGDVYRTEPTEYYPIGQLGVDIYIDGNKKFLPHSMADDICAYGQMVLADVCFGYLLKDGD